MNGELGKIEVVSDMTWMNQIRLDIVEIKDPVELAEYLDGIKANAVMYCSENMPGEAYPAKGLDVSIVGMIEFLKSKI